MVNTQMIGRIGSALYLRTSTSVPSQPVLGDSRQPLGDSDFAENSLDFTVEDGDVTSEVWKMDE